MIEKRFSHLCRYKYPDRIHGLLLKQIRLLTKHITDKEQLVGKMQMYSATQCTETYVWSQTLAV